MESKYDFRIEEHTDRLGGKMYHPQKRQKSKYFSWFFTWDDLYGLYYLGQYNTLEDANKDIHDYKVRELKEYNSSIIKTKIIKDE